MTTESTTSRTAQFFAKTGLVKIGDRLMTKAEAGEQAAANVCDRAPGRLHKSRGHHGKRN